MGNTSYASNVTSGLNNSNRHDTMYRAPLNQQQVKPVQMHVKKSFYDRAPETMKVQIFMKLENEKPKSVDLSIFKDETARDVLDLLTVAEKLKPRAQQVLYEEIPKLNLVRFFEDQESIFNALSHWPLSKSKIQENKLSYASKPNKYQLIEQPETVFAPPDILPKQQKQLESLRQKILDRTFPLDAQNFTPIEFKSKMYMKEQQKKRWVKKMVIINANGLFVAKGSYKKYNPKKTELRRAAHLSECCLYMGFNWKKVLKSPTDFCFALKSPLVQVAKSKHIAYFCCENEDVFNRWWSIIRAYKYGSILRENYTFITSSQDTRIQTTFKGHHARLNSSHTERSRDSISTLTRGAPRIPSTPNNFNAPLSEYYQKGGTKMTGQINDFPPPPAFVHELENLYDTNQNDTLNQTFSDDDDEIFDDHEFDHDLTAHAPPVLDIHKVLRKTENSYEQAHFHNGQFSTLPARNNMSELHDKLNKRSVRGAEKGSFPPPPVTMFPNYMTTPRSGKI